ncbi:MAG: SUMF1/EgtB/PvdO family nonheme iron enzyme [Planctomycetes bacterium]|nr:SUMF1/EgtB/PvdO family nonheme iron enzyme [Planctomycetota bacterium]
MKNRARTGLGSVALCGTLLAISPHAAAQTMPNYGLEWALVGEPGNRGTKPFETQGIPHWSIGAVEHEFRISKTQLSVTQWLEFVQAYEPYYTGFKNDNAFTGANIHWSSQYGYRIGGGTENYPANMSWHYAARYANWLHNDKASEQWAFENGAYDTSTFFTIPGTNLRADQIEHHPDAKFWIPTLHEWTKAVYYDPNRYGPGEEGYWLHPDGGMEQLVSGLPGTPGAETSGGIFANDVDIGLYPNTGSLRGLLDTSGGRPEWTETVASMPGRTRWKMGSRTGSTGWFTDDRLDFFRQKSPQFFGQGLRLSSQVPSPGVVSVLGPGFILTLTRRKRK